jgi:Xanthine dehydrogenase, iron-sulfur cluster and FAD-binding subunit A
MEHDYKVGKADVERALGGNICRCTGYRPILDTFQSFATDACDRVRQKCADIEVSFACEMVIMILTDWGWGIKECGSAPPSQVKTV